MTSVSASHTSGGGDDGGTPVPRVVQVTEDLVMIEVAGRRVIAEARCPHRKGKLRFAHVDGQKLRIRCQLHQSTFDLENGETITGPACTPLRVITSLPDTDGDGSEALERR